MLTAEQLTGVGFPNSTRARHRLLLLHQRGVLARFRRYVWPGTQPWHYTLGLLGEAIHAARSGAPLPRPAKVQEKIIRLAQSRTLDHLVGVNGVFAALLRHASTHPGCALVEWWPESRVGPALGGIVRPDGYGHWTETDRSVGFMLEYDTGTERLDTVTGKLDRYAELADAGVHRPVLFVFTSPARHDHFHRAASRHPAHHTVPVATTSTDHLAALDGPAGPVWLPLGATRRVRLIDLGPPPGTPAGPVEPPAPGPPRGSPSPGHREPHGETVA